MRHILNTTIALLFLVSLSACYHPDIQQGNEMTNAQVNQLKKGMTKQQVTAILEQPVLKNIFDNDTLTYVYTNEPNRGDDSERKVILHFSHNKLDRIEDTGLIVN